MNKHIKRGIRMNLSGLPELVIFDMDGLMFDTERLFRDHLKIAAAGYGYEITNELYAKTLGTSGVVLREIMCGQLGPDYPLEEISAETWVLVNQYIDECGIPVKPGIPELLEWLCTQHIPCCVASSTHSDKVKHHLKAAGLDAYFSHVTGGDMVERSKPDPEIFLTACASMHTAPQDALVLEDSSNGVRAALAGEIPVICIPDLKQPDPDLPDQTVAVLTSASDVITYLGQFV